MSSSVDTAVPTIVLVTLVTLIGVIYGTLELYDNESSAWDVLKGLLSGDITLWDIWEGKKDRSGICAGPDLNAAYMYDEKGNCTFIGCKPGYFEQNGICIQQRDRSGDVYGGQEAVDCEFDGYKEVTTCIPKDPNVTCGIGVGTKQREPNVINGAIGGGSCPSMMEVDCDIECLKECTIDKDEAYKEVEGAEVKAADTDGNIVVLGKASGFCGTGTTIREYNPQGISDQFLIDAGYDTLEDYLNEVNPGNVCPKSEPYSKVVPCGIGDNGEPMKDISCSYGTRVYEPIKNDAGESACFKTSVAEDFIAGNISFTKLQEGELPIITPDNVPLNDNGEYDWTKVPDNKRKGRRIKYLSSLGVSAQSLQDNKCTLMMTEECNARVQDVDCEIGETLDPGPCTDTTCDNNQHQAITRGVVTKQFGNGQECPTYTPVTYRACTTKSIDCCTDADYEPSNICKNDGKMTYTLDTSNCDKNSLPGTKEVDCCYIGGWNSGECNVDNKPGYKKYTRNVPNVDACTNAQLGVHEPGDPTVKYTRDASACDKDCVIGAITYTDRNPDGTWIVIDDYGNQNNALDPSTSNALGRRARKVSYAGSTPAEGLGDNWCATWENDIRSCPSCSDTTNVDGVIMTSSAGLLPINADRTGQEKAADELDIRWGGSNFFSCYDNRVIWQNPQFSVTRSTNCPWGSNNDQVNSFLERTNKI